jgi:hypothetical protein
VEVVASPERIAKWLAFVATPLSTIATHHARFYGVLYPQLRMTYDLAGCPYGRREEDMWRWWQHRARRERARWLARHRQQPRPGAPN